MKEVADKKDGKDPKEKADPGKVPEEGAEAPAPEDVEGEGENGAQETPGEKKDASRGFIMRRFNYFALFVLLFLSVISLSELAERAEIGATLEQAITDINATIAASLETNSDKSQGPEVQSLRFKKTEIVDARTRLRAIEINGAKRVGEQSRLLEVLLVTGPEGAGAVKPGSGEPGSGAQRSNLAEVLAQFASMIRDVVDFLDVTGQLRQMSSQALLAFLIIFCGGIGSLIAGLRSERGYATVRPLALGLSSGFVALLAIKGSKFLILIQAPSGTFADNPYGTAFLGILVGLFTETAYDLLRFFVDKGVTMLKEAAGERNDTAQNDGKTA